MEDISFATESIVKSREVVVAVAMMVVMLAIMMEKDVMMMRTYDEVMMRSVRAGKFCNQEGKEEEVEGSREHQACLQMGFWWFVGGTLRLVGTTFYTVKGGEEKEQPGFFRWMRRRNED
ncbi:hypothetical protein NE237_016323 [Protea cynaroides]|uniref:Transmembrane protein n=1 Tax=Protea cynaroides TaxID=273540 RepID=A0A9Q0JRS0_9MAGN|nr:hypothetical protein NE237_016323 [Protea cynaroides]